MLGAVFSFFTNLFGGTGKAVDTIEKVGGAIATGLDKVIFTDQEKSETLQKTRDMFTDFVKTTVSENSIRSVTRRWLAFSIVLPGMACFVSGVIAQVAGAAEAANALFNGFNTLMPVMIGVLAFYFGPHLIGARK